MTHTPSPTPTRAPTTAEPTQGPAARARRRIEAAVAAAEALDGRLGHTSRARIGAFLLWVGPLLMLETAPDGWTAPLLVTGAVGFVAFALLVRRHRRLRAARDRERLREQLHLETLARLERRWNDAPLPPLEPAAGDHPYAADLDILGRGSLAHLLGRVGTAPGRAALRRTLLDPLAPPPAGAAELLAPAHGGQRSGPPTPPAGSARDWLERTLDRQRAVDLLAARPDLLEEIELAGRVVEGEGSSGRTLAFVEWAGSPTWLAERRHLLPAAWAVTIFNLVTGVAWFAGWIAPPVWVVGMIAAFVLNRGAAGPAHSRFAAAEGGEGDPARWAGILEAARQLSPGDPVLDSIRAHTGPGEAGATGALQRLGRICDVAAVRYSSLAHFPLVALCAWDIHVLARLESWQREHGAKAEAWVRAVAELELLAALAGLRHEHPGWCFPTFDGREEGTPSDPAPAAEPAPPVSLRGRALGHPLLPPPECVGNDVDLPGPGQLLLVTGSNMAGKTTLLRAMGANQILALAGGPVAAGSFVTQPVLPWTAMRVSDSLNEGVSYFMAELKRLRRVVDAAREGPILYLLDEILQGTNTAERRTAARIVLGHLLATEAVGAVTTHDLTLADAPELQDRCVDIHFREEVVNEDGARRLHFDYRLRPGPATSRNALLLLELVGLGPRE